MSTQPPNTEKLLELLTTCYSGIVHHAQEHLLPTAERSFYSTRDYALGDTVSCNADAALENCEQIRSCFPPGVPAEVLHNIDLIEAEIRRLDRLNQPFLAGKWWIIAIVAAVAFFVYFLLTHNRAY